MGRKNYALPKRMHIMKKSLHMIRWLIRNPWIMPMSVFNLAALKIQALYRGYRIRKPVITICIRKVARKAKRSGTKQLDKYLKYLDVLNHSKKKRPFWIESGYSSWCAVRIQAFFKMLVTRRRYLYHFNTLNQIASMVIQTAFKNYLSRKYLMHTKFGIEDITSTERKMSPSPKLLIIDEWQRNYQAAQSIQQCWRRFCGRRVYHYFRDLVKFKLKNAPAELLKAIIPNEAGLLDSAAGVHVRFRLGGATFPPKILFKIFTHRPLCDVNAFAPRDYVQERKQARDCDEFAEAIASGKSRSGRREVKSIASGKQAAGKPIKVGLKYFDTIVSSMDPNGMSNWYKRDEQNYWRPVSSVLIANAFTPSWLTQDFNVTGTKTPAPFHFSRLKRKEDVIRERKRKKILWMRKAYFFAFGGIREEIGSRGDELLIEEGYRRVRNQQSSPPDSMQSSRLSFGVELDIDEDISIKGAKERGRVVDHDEGAVVESDEEQNKWNDAICEVEEERSEALSLGSHRSDHFDANSHHGGGGRPSHGRGAEPMVSKKTSAGASQPGRTLGVGQLYTLAPESDNDDLLRWSVALDYEDYSNTWSSLATSMPSDRQRK